MQSFELLVSPAAALWHPQLRKTCSKRAFPLPRAHMHTHAASERADTHMCLTRKQARHLPDILCGLARALCNRHWFNRAPGPNRDGGYLSTLRSCSDASYADLPLPLLGAPVSARPSFLPVSVPRCCAARRLGAGTTLHAAAPPFTPLMGYRVLAPGRWCLRGSSLSLAWFYKHGVRAYDRGMGRPRKL